MKSRRLPMKKIISLFLTCLMMLAMCACGEKQPDPSDPATQSTSQNISDGNATDGDVTDAVSTPTTEPDATTQQFSEVVTQNVSDVADATLPVLEDYTFTAQETKNVTNYTFEGEKKNSKTCNKIIMVNDDGATQLSVSFAEDGSGLTVFTLNPDGTKYTTLARFDRQGRLVGIFNGSGAYTDYIYESDNTCVMQAYDADGNLLDYRKYYYDDNEITQKVERGDGQDILETYDYVNDAGGKTTAIRIENDTGYILYEYQYDEQGNAISRRIEQNNSFYGLQLYTYDANGKRTSYSFRNDENGPHELDMTVNYNNVYAADGTYLGTAEVDSVTGEVYIAVAYDYVETQYPHYAEFLENHFMTY